MPLLIPETHKEFCRVEEVAKKLAKGMAGMNGMRGNGTPVAPQVATEQAIVLEQTQRPSAPAANVMVFKPRSAKTLTLGDLRRRA